ncbi:hypothetical protein D3C81_1829940 [compost metagenome]
MVVRMPIFSASSSAANSTSSGIEPMNLMPSAPRLRALRTASRANAGVLMPGWIALKKG